MPTSAVMLEQELDDRRVEDPETLGVNVTDLDAARLLRRAAHGDPRAWEQLVDQYGRLIWSITRDFKLVENDAADVFQTTWMRLIEHIDRIEHADRVVAMENGRIVEQGPHAELLAAGGLYARLHSMQFRGA